jgi:hypothetical protein
MTDPNESFLSVSMTMEQAKIKDYVWSQTGRSKPFKERTDADLKDNWRNSPDSMLFWRCLSRISRWRFADIIKNMYIKEVIQDQIGSKDYDPELELGNKIETIDSEAKKTPVKKERLFKKQEVDFEKEQPKGPVKEDKKEPELTKEIIPADIIDLMDKVCEKKKVKSEELKSAIDLSYSVMKQSNPNLERFEFIRDYLKKKLEDSTEKPETKIEKVETKTETKKKQMNNGLLPFQ